MTVLTDRARCLQSIQATAFDISQLIERRQISLPTRLPLTQVSRSVIPPLQFPSAESSVASVDYSDFGPEVSKKLSGKLLSTIQTLQASHRASYEKTCERILATPQSSDLQSSSHILKRLQTTFQKTYLNACLSLVQRHDASLDGARQTIRASRPVPSKSTFNNEYTPIFERYFEHNAYPSVQDRAILARKSMMTPRQIEVWFQNHRRRAKLEGRILRKLQPGSCPFDLSLESLQQAVPDLLATAFSEEVRSPSPDCLSDDDADVDISPIPQDNPLISTTSPTYAYPSKYLSGGLRPSEPRAQLESSSNLWPRNPSRPRKQESLDLNSLVEMFQKLRIRGKQSSSSSSRQPWFSSRVTIPASAPHPALVRPRQPHPMAQPAKRTAPCPRNATLQRHLRKPSPLPKRRPKLNHLPTPSSSTCSSRTSSTSSIASSSSSAISETSSPSPTPNVKPSSPLPLTTSRRLWSDYVYPYKGLQCPLTPPLSTFAITWAASSIINAIS